MQADGKCLACVICINTNFFDQANKSTAAEMSPTCVCCWGAAEMMEKIIIYSYLMLGIDI